MKKRKAHERNTKVDHKRETQNRMTRGGHKRITDEKNRKR